MATKLGEFSQRSEKFPFGGHLKLIQKDSRVTPFTWSEFYYLSILSGPLLIFITINNMATDIVEVCTNMYSFSVLYL